MATKQEKQLLIDTLKFTPRTYQISMWGYGGEKVMGRVDPKVWDYCIKHRINLVDLAWGDEDTFQDDMKLDLDQLPYYPGQWYECDSMAHTHGVSRSAGTIQITDENGVTVFEKSLDDCDGASDSPGWSCQDETWIGQAKKGEVVFIGSSNEKGTFFEGNIELRAPFDIEKLVLYYDEVDGEELVNSVYYDDEEIENYGGSTDGKSSDMDMVRVTDDAGNWERYELPETDDPTDSTASESWDPAAELDKILVEVDELDDDVKTDWFPVKIEPVHVGMYECQFKKLPAWPWPPTQKLQWDGKIWLDDGNTVKGVKKWRGLREPAL
jgi:hypothetical protein